MELLSGRTTIRAVWRFFFALHGARLWHILALTLSGFVTTLGFVALLLPLLEAAGVSSNPPVAAGLGLGQALGLFLLLGLLQSWWVRYQSLVAVDFRETTVHRLVLRLTVALRGVQWEWLLRHRSSDLVQAMQVDIERVSGGAQVLLACLGQATLAAVYLVTASVLVGPVFLVLVPLGAVLLRLTMRRLARATHQGEEFDTVYQEQAHQLANFLVGYKSFRSCGAEEVYLAELCRLTDRRRQVAIEVARDEAGQSAWTRVASLLVLAGFVWWAVTVRHMPAAELLVLLYAMARLTPAAQSLASLLTQLFFLAPAVLKVERLLRELEGHQVQEGPPLHISWGDGDGVLVQDVDFRYPSGRGLSRVAFQLPSGSWSCLSGPSGSGKSTLTDILLGLLSPDSGRVVMGEQVFPKGKEWRRSLAYVPQQAFLFGTSLRNNLWLGYQGDRDDEEAWRQLRLLGLEERCRAMPEGLDTVLLDAGQDFSIGERQRLGLVRALLRKPRLLVLDEPTANLDLASERLVMQALEAYRGQMIVLVVSHQAGWLERVDQVLTLRDGVLAATSDIARGEWHSRERGAAEVAEDS